MYIYNNRGEKFFDLIGGFIAGILIIFLSFQFNSFKSNTIITALIIYLIALAGAFGIGRKMLIIGLLLVLAIPLLVFGACLIIFIPMGGLGI